MRNVNTPVPGEIKRVAYNSKKIAAVAATAKKSSRLGRVPTFEVNLIKSADR